MCPRQWGASSPTSPSFHYYFLDESRRPSAGAIPSAPQPGYDVYAVRRDFPILNQQVNGYPLIWLDNAATTQKPQAVIDRLVALLQHENSNVHRGAHELAARATDAYEDAREKVRGFLGASSSDEIVFVRGATEAINLVAQSWGRQNIGKDDEIVITWLEHHANIVPWQQLCTEKGAVLAGGSRGRSWPGACSTTTKSCSGPGRSSCPSPQVSNALGTVTPAKQDGGDGAPLWRARSARRRAGRLAHARRRAGSRLPTGTSFPVTRCSRRPASACSTAEGNCSNAMPPWQGGGNMIRDVTFERTDLPGAPVRFEAGTGNIADAVGLGAAIDYLGRIGMENVAAYEHELSPTRRSSAPMCRGCASSARRPRRRASSRLC